MSNAPDLLTEILKAKLSNPVSSPDFDLHGGVEQMLKDVGMTVADSGGKLDFYGRDPIIASPIRFGAMSAMTRLRQQYQARASSDPVAFRRAGLPHRGARVRHFN